MGLIKKKDTKSTKSTVSTFTESSNSFKFGTWLSLWWPVIILILIIICAGLFKYVFPNPEIYDLTLKMIKAVGVLMVMLYVIYTRLLAIETKKMAEASMGLYRAEKGTVLTEIKEEVCNINDACDDVKKITKKLHIEDKKIPVDEFEKLINDKNITSVSLKIKNRSGRRIDVNKIDFIVRHTGSDKYHPALCDISDFGTIGPWEDIKIPLILAPEGEVELTINWIYYLDGGVVQKKSISDNNITIERIRKPEN